MPGEALRSGQSVDHLVGQDQSRRRHGEAERFGCLQVDHEFEFGWLLDREIGGLSAFEDFIDVVGCLAEQIRKIRAVDSQSALIGVVMA
jgi:hypothetical protein